MEHDLPELAPISGDSPAGQDVRYEQEFEELQAEIDKLSLPSATSGVDWQKVRSLASGILQDQSKDLLVASYLAAAEIRLNDLEGFLHGLAVFKGMLDQYWDALFPTKKRMRGRVAAVNWWLEKSAAALDEVSCEPLAPDYVESMRVTLRAIDELLRQHLDEAPLLRPLERIIDELPLREQEIGEKPAAEPEQKPPETPVQATPENKPAAAETPSQPIKVEAAPVVSSIASVSAAEIEKILRGALQTIRQASDFYFDKDLANPRAYRFRRIAGWTMIQALPPSTDSQTQIPPPGECEETKTRLNEYRALEKWQELLRESEYKLQSSLLWLDLNRLSYESLNNLGNQYADAAEAICQETAGLLHRLSGLERLTFADGTPLADAETKQWIESIKPGEDSGFQAAAPAAGLIHEQMDLVLEQAKSLAAAKKISDGVTLVKQEMQRSPSGHERLLWRLGLAQLLMNYRQTRHALPHLDVIVSEIEQYGIEQWDPALATHALKIVWLGYRNEKGTKEQAETILGRIARLDPAEAIALEKR